MDVFQLDWLDKLINEVFFANKQEPQGIYGQNSYLQCM